MHIRRMIVAASSMVLLSGCAAALQPAPTSLVFYTMVGDSDTRQVSWTNTGRNAVQVDLIDLNGDPPFSLFGPTIAPGLVGPGASTPVTGVVFAPTRDGVYTAAAIPSSLTGRDMNAREVSIMGVAERPAIIDSPFMVGRPAPIPPGAATHVIDFGTIPAGTTAYRAVTITNVNTALGALQSVFFQFASGSGGVFGAAVSEGGSLTGAASAPPNGGQVTIHLQFAPQAPGTFQDTLVFISIFGTHYTLDLEGKATAG